MAKEFEILGDRNESRGRTDVEILGRALANGILPKKNS